MKKHAAIFCVLMLFVLCMTGCAEQAGANLVAGKVYTYSGESFSGLEIDDDFTITIHEDGTYSYYESLLSSYIGKGTWSVADDVLTLSDDTGAERINRFFIDGEDLVFVEEDSTNFIYVKVEDGERFHGAPISDESRDKPI